MVQRQIAITISGKKNIEDVSNLITKVQSSVKNLEKSLEGLKSPSISVGFKLNSTGLYAEIRKVIDTNSGKDSNNPRHKINVGLRLVSTGFNNSVRTVLDNVSKNTKLKVTPVLEMKGAVSNIQSQIKKLETVGAEENEKKRSMNFRVNLLKEGLTSEVHKLSAYARQNNIKLKLGVVLTSEGLSKQADAIAQEIAKNSVVKSAVKRANSLLKNNSSSSSSDGSGDASSKLSAEEVRRVRMNAITRDARSVSNDFALFDRLFRQAKEVAKSGTVEEQILANYIGVAKLSAFRRTGVPGSNGRTIYSANYQGMFVDPNTGKPYGVDTSLAGGIRTGNPQAASVFDFLANNKSALEFIDKLNDGFGVTTDEIAKRFQENFGIVNDEIDKAQQNFLEFMRSLDQIQSALDNFANKYLNTMKTIGNIGVVQPAKVLSNAFMTATNAIISSSARVGTSIGNNLMNGFRNGFNRIGMYARQVVQGLADETKELGDAMRTYEINMEKFGWQPDQIRRSMKELGDYGRKTVYDASELLKQASTYTAYGREDANEIVKAIAGFTATTATPNEGMTRIGDQLNDMLATEKVRATDLRFMRGWMNALGASRLNAALLELAKGKGYDTVNKAISEGAISPQEFLDQLKAIGLSEDLQALVEEIRTPSQAWANLKETLANQLVYKRFYEDANGVLQEEEGALFKLYMSTVDLIKGISNIVETDRFARNVKAIGNGISTTIDYISGLGKGINQLYGSMMLTRAEGVLRNFATGLDQRARTSLSLSVQQFFGAINDVLADTQGAFFAGGFVADYLASIFRILTEGARVLPSVARSYSRYVLQFNNSVREVLSLIREYDIATVLGEVLIAPLNTLDEVLVNLHNNENVTKFVNSVQEFANTLFGRNGVVSHILNAGGGINTALNVLTNLVRFFSSVMRRFIISTPASTINKFFDNIQKAIKYLLEGLAPIYSQLASSIVKAGASEAGRRFFQAIADFVVSVNEAIRNALSKLGNGSIEQGIEKIINILTSFINYIGDIVTFMGNHPYLSTALYLVPKSLSAVITIIKSAYSAVEALRGLGMISGGVATAGGSATGLISSVVSLGGTSAGVIGGNLGSKVMSGFSALKNSVLAYQLAGNYVSNSKYAYSKLTPNVFIAGSSGVQAVGTKQLYLPLPEGYTIPPTTLWGKTKGLFNSVDGFMSKMSTPKAQLALWATDAVVQGVNNFVQQSEASATTKKISQVGSDIVGVTTSGFGGYAIGSLIGGGIGALFTPAGAVVGAKVGGWLGAGLSSLASGMGIYNRNKTKEAERLEIERQQEEFEASVSEYAQDASRQILLGAMASMEERALIASKLKKEDGAGSVDTALQYISSLAQGSGKSFNEILTELGVAEDAVPTGVKDMFVKLGNDIVSFQELMYATGLDEVELTSLLQFIKGNIEGGVLEFVDKTGEKVVATINSLEPKFEVNQDVSEFINGAKSNGINIGNYGSVLDVTADLGGIGDALSRKYETNEEAIQAVINSVGNQSLRDALEGKTLDEIKTIYETLMGVAIETLGSADQKIEAKKAELIKKIEGLGISGEEKQELLAEYVDKEYSTVEEVDEAIKNLGKKVKETAKATAEKSTEIIEETTTKTIDKWKEDFDELIGEKNPFEDNSFNRVKLLNLIGEIANVDNDTKKYLAGRLSNNVELYLQTIQDLIDEGAITIEEAYRLLNLVDLKGISTDNLSENGQTLYNNLLQTVNDTASKLDETAQKAQQPVQDIDTSNVATKAQSIVPAIQDMIDWAGRQLDNLTSSLNMSASWSNIKKAFGGVGNNSNKPSATQFDGGLVTPLYRAEGGGIKWVRRGTDTVPTMLTEGEYVLRKEAVQSVGLDKLTQINKFGQRALQNFSRSSIIYNVYNNNNARVNQNIDNKSQYLNGMNGLDRLMRYV